MPIGIRSIGIPCAHHVGDDDGDGGDDDTDGGDDDNDDGDDEDVEAGLAMLWRRKLGSRHPGHRGQRCLHHIVRDAYTLYCTRCLRLYIVHNTHCEKITYLRLHFINAKCKLAGSNDGCPVFTSPWLPSYFKF